MTEVIKVEDIKQLEGKDAIRAEILKLISNGKIPTYEVVL